MTREGVKKCFIVYLLQLLDVLLESLATYEVDSHCHQAKFPVGFHSQIVALGQRTTTLRIVELASQTSCTFMLFVPLRLT